MFLWYTGIRNGVVGAPVALCQYRGAVRCNTNATLWATPIPFGAMGDQLRATNLSPFAEVALIRPIFAGNGGHDVM